MDFVRFVKSPFKIKEMQWYSDQEPANVIVDRNRSFPIPEIAFDCNGFD